MKKSLLKVLLALSLAGFVLAGCTGNTASSAGTSSTAKNIILKVGASPAPHAEILEAAIPLLAEKGITLEITEFSDYVVPNTALDDGSLDANYFQHQPYLDSFNKEKGTDLVPVCTVHFEALGIYPGKTASIDDLADGALVGIPNDVTNEARALHLLAAQGLITLKDGVGLEAVPADIVENPKNLKFSELEAAQLPASLPDLDIAVINGNYALGAEIADTVLALESADSEAAITYANVVAVRAGDENRPEIKALVEALQSDTIREFIEEKYTGTVVPTF